MSSEPAATLDARTDRPGWWYAAGGVALTVFGILVSVLLSVPALLVDLDTLSGFLLSVVLSEAGYAVAAVAFVALTGRGVAYFDLDLPTGWGLVATVAVGAFLFRTVAVVAALALNLDPSPPSIVDVPIPVETLLAVMIPASLLVIGPAEELLFRGTVQKYLRERFSASAAVLGAGVLFAAVHVLALVAATSVGVLLSLGIIFVVGLSFGWLYERTGSVVAPMVAHGVYNALIFGSGLLLTRLV